GEAVLITSADLDAPGPYIEYANPAFTRMTGYEVREAIGRSPRFLQGPQTDAAVLDRMRAALKAGVAFQGEAVNYRKDGST
ncbi:PAS domain-containing protein, partial [Escherichia coli]|nr:PAS domain-containing protein [Escherichia coli]